MESIISSSYAVHFNDQAYQELNAHLASHTYSKVFVLVDENTKQHCLPRFRKNVPGNGAMDILEIASGEIHKNIATCTRLWETLSDLNADRKSLLINLGGGVLTDLGGFVASTFKRGIEFINIPTTLLAMVDASVGGKTGVDLGSLKNQIGVINQARMVLVLPEFLQTLDNRQMHSGFAEMLKHGLIQDKSYWEELKSLSVEDPLDTLIYESVVLKNRIVLKDPTEQHVRKILNYGHTLGHAIESYFLDSRDHGLLHGEAIAVGMILEAYLSHKMLNLPLEELNDIKNTFLNRYTKVDFSKSDIAAILALLKFDKKNSHGDINFVLLNTIGNPEIDVKIPSDFLIEAFAYYKEQ